MSAGDWTFYNGGRLALFDGTVSLTGDTITAALMTADYDPDLVEDSAIGDIDANEVTAQDYERQPVDGVEASRDNSTVLIDADAVSFGDYVTIEAKYCVLIHEDSGTLLLFCDLDESDPGATVSSLNNTFEVRSPEGLFEAE